jgi:hypothetical protein
MQTSELGINFMCATMNSLTYVDTSDTVSLM